MQGARPRFHSSFDPARASKSSTMLFFPWWCACVRTYVRACVCACTCACSQVHLRCNTCMHSCALLMCLCDSGAFLPPAVDVQTSHPCTGRLVHRQSVQLSPRVRTSRTPRPFPDLQSPEWIAFCFFIQRLGGDSSRPRFFHPIMHCTSLL